MQRLLTDQEADYMRGIGSLSDRTEIIPILRLSQ